MLEPGIWFRVLPRVGAKPDSLAEVLASSPWFILEAWRHEGRLRIYVTGQLAEASLRKVVGVRREEPPALEPGYFMAEVRQPAQEFWEPLEAQGFADIYEFLGEGMLLQVGAWREPKAPKTLSKKAAELRGKRGILHELRDGFFDKLDEATGQDPMRRERLKRMRSSPGEEEMKRRKAETALARLRHAPFYIVRLRVYGPEKKAVRELAELVASRFTRPLEVKGAGLLARPMGSRGVAQARRIPGPAGFLSSPSKTLLWMNTRELKSILVLPDPSLHPVEAERAGELPEVLPERRGGVLLGYTSRGGRPVYLSLEDFHRHVYVVGSTGSGKTTTLERLVEQLREAYRAGANLVVVDPHGDFAREAAGMFWGEPGVYYLHPLEAPFALNPLELPRGLPRDVAVMLAVDQLMEIFEKLFLLGENAVYVRYILQTGLRLLYRRTDAPTFTDLYEMIVALREGTLDLPVDDPEYREALEVIQGLQDQSFISAIARLELIAKTPLLARTFSQTSIPDGVLLGPGNLVVFNLSKADLGGNASYLLMAGVVLKLWYLALARARMGGERTPVIVFIDEFQNVAKLQAIDVILSEARKYGLHLVLAHQHSRQLSEDMVQSIYSNTGVKILMRTIGPDAERFSRVDPHYSRELKATLPALAVGEAVVIVTPRRGEQAAPARVQVEPPSRRPSSFTPRPVFGPGSGGGGGGRVVELLNPVLAMLPGERLGAEELLVLYRVWRAGRAGREAVEWSRILSGLGLRRQRAEDARDSLAARGYIDAWKEGNRWLIRYVKGLFQGLKTVAPSKEGRRIAAKALVWYLEHGYYTAPARQGGPAAPDLVAIPYDRAAMRLRYSEAIAVEIESCNELETHPEQVARNLVKNWELKQRGVITRVEFWTTSRCKDRLQQILDQAARDNQIPGEAYRIHSVEEKPAKSKKQKQQAGETKPERQQEQQAKRANTKQAQDSQEEQPDTSKQQAENQPKPQEPSQAKQPEDQTQNQPADSQKPAENLVEVTIQGTQVKLTRQQYREYRKLILLGWKPTITQNGTIQLKGPKGQTQTIKPKTPNQENPGKP